MAADADAGTDGGWERESIMPLYEFQCLSCENKFDRFVALNTKSVKCPLCGHKAIKLISLPGAIIVDGNFSLTGRVDKRLGDTPIAGRKDYNQRVKEKGFRELSSKEMKDLVEDADDRGEKPAKRVLPEVSI